MGYRRDATVGGGGWGVVRGGRWCGRGWDAMAWRPYDRPSHRRGFIRIYVRIRCRASVSRMIRS